MMLFLLTRVKIVFHLSGFCIKLVSQLAIAMLFLGYNVQDMSLFTMTQNDTTRVYLEIGLDILQI